MPSHQYGYIYCYLVRADHMQTNCLTVVLGTQNINMILRHCPETSSFYLGILADHHLHVLLKSKAAYEFRKEGMEMPGCGQAPEERQKYSLVIRKIRQDLFWLL